MNSVIVTTACTVQTGPYPPQSFTVSQIVQPDNVYYWPLQWAGYATDSGIPAVLGGEVPTPIYPARYQGNPIDGDTLVWSSAAGLYLPNELEADEKGEIATAENITGDATTLAISPSVAYVEHIVVTVQPTDAIVWLEWEGFIGVQTAGGGSINTRIYETTGGVAVWRAGASQRIEAAMPATVANGPTFSGKWRLGPVTTERSFGLWGTILRDAGSSLAADIRNVNGQGQGTRLTAVAR